MAARRARCSTCSTRSAPPSAPSLCSRAMLDRGERLMGFGHRIYRVRDPRADALKAALGKLGRTRRGSTWRSPSRPRR